jgi:hypothetical protein
MQLSALDDTARFQADAAEPLVEAAFACPYCMYSATFVRLPDEFEAGAACVCVSCRAGWTVELSEQQLLRMVLSPPRALHVSGGTA